MTRDEFLIHSCVTNGTKGNASVRCTNQRGKGPQQRLAIGRRSLVEQPKTLKASHDFHLKLLVVFRRKL